MNKEAYGWEAPSLFTSSLDLVIVHFSIVLFVSLTS